MVEYRVVAYNRAETHANRVHDSVYARSLGLRGGLVPGVDVFAYMAHPVLEQWGLAWLGGGRLEARFSRPVYDGDRLRVTATPAAETLALELTNAEAEVCATGSASWTTGEAAPDPAAWPIRPLPEEPPPATPEAFAASPVLGALTVAFDEAAGRAQLAEVRESLPEFAELGIVHPGHLLRLADSVLSANVALPPWMHVSSRAAFLAPVRWGDELSVRARVLDVFEKKGHRFVQLDVLAVRGQEPVMRVEPYTAIYRPSWPGTDGT